jgi:hypothetical protein
VQRYLRNTALLLAALLACSGFVRSADFVNGECSSQETQHIVLAAAGDRAALDRAFCAMYDLEFTKADSEITQFTEQHPEDPLGPVVQAASTLFFIFEQNKILQTEFFTPDDRYTKRQRIMPDASTRQHFDSKLRRAEQLSTECLARNASDENALLALTLVYGLRADYAAMLEHQDLAALRFSNKGNEWARKLLAISPESYDAYVATGIQKYLVGLKPAPVRWMLRFKGIKGDRDEGLRELELAAAKGHYLAPFARILLAIAYLRKDEQEAAMELLTGLRQEFPNNPLFAEELARVRQMDGTAQRRSVSNTGTP